MTSNAAIEQVHALATDRPLASRGQLKFDWIEARREMVTALPSSAAQLTCSRKSVARPKPRSHALIRIYPEHINLLNSEILRLNTVCSEEIARLNTVYPTETARLSDEIVGLKTSYLAEIDRRDADIAHLTAEVASLRDALENPHASLARHVAARTKRLVRAVGAGCCQMSSAGDTK